MKDYEYFLHQVYEHGDHCHDCEWHYTDTERHPYGEGYAIETLRYCELIEYPNMKDKCPIAEEMYEDQAEHDE